MRNYTEVAAWGFTISALGTIPLGTLNVTAMQVAVSKGLNQGIFFSLGVALVEVAYVRVTLVAIHWIRTHTSLLRLMDWIAVCIVLVLAAGSFMAATNSRASSNFILQSNIPFFVLGLLMSALNPLQLPFWMGWSSFLFTKKVLHPQSSYYNWYTIGIGIGTMGGLAVFVYGGRILVDVLNTKQQLINYIVGIIFVITAIVQLIKIVGHKGLAETAEVKAAELEKVEEYQS
jgi:threonine/homoserine/homoserine lactone efflux protein